MAEFPAAFTEPTVIKCLSEREAPPPWKVDGM
jgi:hypothetical protein